jgi:hypothetical protein
MESYQIILAIAIGILSNIFTPWLFRILNFFSERWSFKTGYNLQGVYDCEYRIPWKAQPDDVVFEEIYLHRKWFLTNQYVGYLLKSEKDGYRTTKKATVRVECLLCGELYLVGYWRHPNSTDRTFGSFVLKLDRQGNVHSGLWSGESSTHHRVLSGRWIWRASDRRPPLTVLF